MVRMKLGARPALVALLLGIASSSFACGARGVNKAGADEQPPAGWKRYDFQKPLAFSLLLPGEPEQRVGPLPGGEEISHAFISADNSGVYGATYISDLTAVAGRWESSGNELFYEIFVKDFAAEMTRGGGGQSVESGSGVRFTADRQVTVSGLEALERDFSI